MHPRKFHVSCPSCHDRMTIDPEVAGRGMRCGSCRDVLYVPYPIAERVFCDAAALPAIIIQSAAIAG